MSKRIDDRTFDKFINDVKSLRSIYTDAKIAAIMKTNAGNFSSRINGVKRPGQDFIDKFYQVLGKKLNDIAESELLGGSLTESVESDKPKEDFPGSANGLGERIQRMENSLSRLETCVSILMERLVISHQKLIDGHLAFLQAQSQNQFEQSVDEK